MFFWFPKKTNEKVEKFTIQYEPYRIQYCIPNNIVLLVTMENFEPHPIW
jgi:hypothetical protein